LEQKKKIEDAVEFWHSAVAPTSPILYIGIFVLILILFWALIMRFRKKPAPSV